MRHLRLLLLTVAIAHACPASGDTMTYTGADLYSSPAVSFPSVQPTVVGTSLQFPKGDGHHAMQLLMPLVGAPRYDFSLNLTRTATLGDWDPFLLMGDGSRLLGGLYGDDQGGFAFSCVQSSCEADRTFSSIFGSNNVPPLGTLTLDIAFLLDPLSTTILLSFSGAATGTGSHTFNFALSQSSLFFTLLDDNDANADFRLNSMSVTATPIPGSLPLFAGGLAVIGLLGWLSKRTPSRCAWASPRK